MYLILLLIALMTFSPVLGDDCPPDMVLVAKCEPELYDGQNFETCFEKGGENIDIGGFSYTPEGEVWQVRWFVTGTVPISAAFVKAGNAGDNLYIYDPPLVPESPPEEQVIGATGSQGISHVSWCSLSGPTAITITSAGYDPYINLVTYSLVAFVVAVFVLFLLMVTSKRRQGDKDV